jgi:hypothetical protein
VRELAHQSRLHVEVTNPEKQRRTLLPFVIDDVLQARQFGRN